MRRGRAVHANQDFFSRINFFCQDGSKEVSHTPGRVREVCYPQKLGQVQFPQNAPLMDLFNACRWPYGSIIEGNKQILGKNSHYEVNGPRFHAVHHYVRSDVIFRNLAHRNSHQPPTNVNFKIFLL